MKKKQRLPFAHRVDKPPSMYLTERDIAVIKAVYEYRFLQREQIQQLFFPSVNTANYRLQRLFQHRYLQRIFAPDHYIRNARNSQAIYCLDEAGATLVATELGVPREQVSWYPERNRVKEYFIQHLLKINDFRIALTNAADGRSDSIVTWVPEWRLKEYGEFVNDPLTGKRLPVSPDGYFIYEEGRSGKRSHFFLELDRSTMENRRFAKKIKAYIQYIKTGAYQHRYRTRSLRVLTVVPSEHRLRNLKETTEKAGGKSMFWFTTYDALQPTTILQPVWWIAGQRQYAALTN